MSLVFLRGQAAFMNDRGFDVHVISSPGPELSEFGRRENVQARAVQMHRRITPLRDLIALCRLAFEIRRIKPAIVHAHTPKGGLLGTIAATFCRTPVRVYHMRGMPLAGATGWKRRLLWATEWLSCRLAHEVICVSNSLRMEAVALGIASPAKVKVLANGSGNGVDAAHRFNPEKTGSEAGKSTRTRLEIPDDAVVIGFIGRIVRDKGIVELVDAWQQLRTDHPNARLLIVGPFEPQDPVPIRTEEALRRDPRIHLVGTDWNTPALYAAMDIVALPTYREGFPNVLLEAAAMRLPAVATRVPGCVDAIADEETGLLVSPRNADELRNALARYLREPELRRKHGVTARKRVMSDFTQEKIWYSLHAEYVALLDGQRHHEGN